MDMHTPRVTDHRNLLFICFTVITAALFFVPLKELFVSALRSSTYDYIVLIPPVSGFFLYARRGEISAVARYAPLYGVPVAAVGTILYFVAARQAAVPGGYDYLSLAALSAVLVFAGGFISLYGVKALRAASFPLLFLVFMVPVPDGLMGRIVGFLQSGSTEAAYGIFRLAGVPVVRDGFTFYLSGMSVEVAEQCSGIHSGISLFITAVIAAHLFLRKGSRKAVLLLAVLPITIVKNGMRIFTLAVLGAYWDPRVLDSQLHKKGGIPFFIVALLLLGCVLYALRKWEAAGPAGGDGPDTPGHSAGGSR